MNQSTMRDIDERTNLASNSMFELLLFRLGEARSTAQRELFGINVFAFFISNVKHIFFLKL